MIHLWQHSATLWLDTDCCPPIPSFPGQVERPGAASLKPLPTAPRLRGVMFLHIICMALPNWQHLYPQHPSLTDPPDP